MTSSLIVGDALREQAKSRPDKLLVWCGDDRITYADMDARSDRVAAGLTDLGVTKGDRVAFVVPNRPEMLELFFACAKIGAIQVPLNAYLKGEFLRYQLGDSQASTLVVDDAGLNASLPLIGALPDLRRLICLDEARGEGIDVVDYGSVRSSGSPVPPVDMVPGDLMSILYTSGTTGLPKGCMMSHGYYTHSAARMEDTGLREDDVFFTALPLFHGAASIMVTLAVVMRGASAVVEPVFSVTTVLDRLVETGATALSLVGAMGMAMLAIPPSEKDRAHRLRQAAFVPFSVEQQIAFEQRFGCPVHSEMFGQTECVPITFSHADGPRKPGTAGRPSSWLEVRLVDDDDHEVPAGEAGEIIVRPRVPHAMFSGYWNKPEATLEAWRGLWHHTGDYGRADDEGFITFVDRKKDAVRRRGENVSSMELEAAIARHPKILEAAIHAVPSEMTEDDIKACIVLEAGAEITPEELFEFFKTNLPYFAVPRYVEIIPELPRNALLRVMKHTLREKGVTENTWDLEAKGLVIDRRDRRG